MIEKLEAVIYKAIKNSRRWVRTTVGRSRVFSPATRRSGNTYQYYYKFLFVVKYVKKILLIYLLNIYFGEHPHPEPVSQSCK